MPPGHLDVRYRPIDYAPGHLDLRFGQSFMPRGHQIHSVFRRQGLLRLFVCLSDTVSMPGSLVLNEGCPTGTQYVAAITYSELVVPHRQTIFSNGLW